MYFSDHDIPPPRLAKVEHLIENDVSDSDDDDDQTSAFDNLIRIAGGSSREQRSGTVRRKKRP